MVSAEQYHKLTLEGKQASLCATESHKSSAKLLKAFVSDGHHGENKKSSGLVSRVGNEQRPAWVSQLAIRKTEFHFAFMWST